jgi:crotonobetainyl-CoA:carnitine CoA-transferase CaiB-like acyl-CoA transferase
VHVLDLFAEERAALLDLLAGLEAAVGALAALVGRGRPRTVEVSLIEAGVTSLINVLGNVLASGVAPERWGSGHPNIVPYQAFAASDGEMVIAVGNDAQFGRLLGVLGLEDRDHRFGTNADRVARRDDVVAQLAAEIATRRRDDLLDELAAADVPAGPVNTVAQALDAMEAAHPGGWIQERGGVRLAPDPILIDGERLRLRREPPRLGEHTVEVLSEIGLDDAEIASLRRGNVIG